MIHYNDSLQLTIPSVYPFGITIGQLVGRYQFNEDPAEAWKLPEFYNELDAAGIQEAGKTYLSNENRIQVTLMPEKK